MIIRRRKKSLNLKREAKPWRRIEGWHNDFEKKELIGRIRTVFKPVQRRAIFSEGRPVYKGNKKKEFE